MKDRIYAIYKKAGPTSHDIVDNLRKITGIKKIGHAGTLDPRACGILVVGIGREATKKLNTIVKKEKEYLAKIKLGEASTTFDAEGDKRECSIKKIPMRVDVKRIIPQFIGKIKQTPPQYSAIKIKGKAAYRYARAGKTIKIKSREVKIKSIIVKKYKWPILNIKVICGPGVYIRSLANDIGGELKVGGYLLELERIRVGKFTKQKSLTIEKFKKLWEDGNTPPHQ